MPNNSNVSFLFSPQSNGNANASNAQGALASILEQPTPEPIQQDVRGLVDPRKVYLAMQNQQVDGLNDVERDFATKSFNENLAKYGNQAYGIDSSISATASTDLTASTAERKPLQMASDGLVSATNGLAQGLIGTAEFANRLNPLTRALDLVTPSGTGITDSISKGLSSLSSSVNDIADNLTSDVVHQDRLIRSYKNQLDEARHAREEADAIANGQSAFTASMVRIAKDAGSGFANALSSPTAIMDSTAEFVGSMAAFGAAGKVASLAAKGAGKLAGLSETALTKAQKLATNEMAHVAAQEGGSASLDAYQTAQNMTDEELMQSSEQYRDVKADALANGASELEAEQIAKDAVANRAATTSALITGAITAPMGKLLPKEIFKSPKGQFVQGGLKKSVRETVEEGLEGLGQFGSNIGAKVSYNNNQDLAEGVGTNIGEGAASAGVGSGIIQSPSMAKSALKAGFKKTADLHDEAKTKSNIKKLRESAPIIEQAIASMDKVETEAPKVEDVELQQKLDETDGNVINKDEVKDTLSKIKDLNTPLTEEEAEQINNEAGAPVTKAGFSKIDTLLRRTKHLENSISQLEHLDSATDDQKLYTLGQIANYEKYRESILPLASVGNILKQVDDNNRDSVKEVLGSYRKMISNPKFEAISNKATKYANEIITANNSIDAIYGDEKLSDEEKSKKIDSVLTAYKHLVHNNIATDEQLENAKEFINGLDEKTKNNANTVAFLNEITSTQKLNSKIQQNILAEQKDAEKVAKSLGFSKEDAINFQKGNYKSMSDVSVEKLEALYDETKTNRKSLASIYPQVLDLFSKGKKDEAYQVLLDYMNFVQSQVNKLNAWKQSKAAYMKDWANDHNSQAKPVYYTTYNPQTRLWKTSDHGIHAGSIELGERLASENKRLVQEFEDLKERFFKGANISISNYNPNEGEITDDFIHKAFDEYLRHSNSNANKQTEAKPQDQAQVQTKEQTPVSEQKQEAPKENVKQEKVEIKEPEVKAEQAPVVETKQVETVTTEEKTNTHSERLTRSKAKLFKADKHSDKVLSFNDIKQKITDGTSGLTEKDVKTLQKELSDTSSSSAFGRFAVVLNSKLENLYKEKTYSEPFAWNDSPVIAQISKSKKDRLTFAEAKSIIGNPEIADKLSDEDIERLYTTFPALVFYSYNQDKGKLTLDKDLVANLFLNAVSQLNQVKDGQGYSYERIARDLGMDIAELRNKFHREDGSNEGLELLEAASKGTYLNPLLNRLSRNVKKSFDLALDPSKFSAVNYQQFPKLLAGLAVQTLADTTFTVNNEPRPILNVTHFDGVVRGLTVFTVAEDVPSILNALEKPEALDKLLNNESAQDTGAIFVTGSEPEMEPSTHNTYEHSDIEMPSEAKKARDNYEKVNYRVDEGMLNIYNSLGEAGLLELFGHDVSDPEHMNPEDLTSKQSKNREITASLAQVQKWIADMSQVAKDNNVPLSQVNKRFRLGVTSVNRIQELEKCGPIANKLTREVLLSTWNKVPVGDKKIETELARAIVQNFGGKLNKNNITNTNAAFHVLLKDIMARPRKYASLMQLVGGYDGKAEPVTADTVRKARESIVSFMKNNKHFKQIGLDDVDMNFMGLHAMQTLALYAKAKKNGEKEIETSIYCEADGTTNGTINAQFLLTSDLTHGSLEHAIMLLDKGNMRIGDSSGESAGVAKDGLSASECDVYGKSGEIAQNKITKALNELFSRKEIDPKVWGIHPNDVPSIQQYVEAVRTLFKFSGQTSDIERNLEDFISRNFMKKPDTKGMYGAGLNSIIATLADSFLTDLYQKHTKVLQAVKGKKQASYLEVAKAMFAGMKGVVKVDKETGEKHEWDDEKYLAALGKYLSAINTVNKVALKRDADDTKNTVRIQSIFGHEGYRIITPNSFLVKDGLSKSINDKAVENIFSSIKSIYGYPINEAIQETIRGQNVNGTQDAMRSLTSTLSVLGNLFRAKSIVDFNAATMTETEFRKAMNDFSDEKNPLCMHLANNTYKLSLVPDDSVNLNILKGGSLNSASSFGNAEFKTNSKYNLPYVSKALTTNYNVLAEPGVKILPNSNIGFGDGMMMQRAMKDMLKQINYATTLIFDGGNSAIGMQDVFGSIINKLQYDSDMDNFVEQVYLKANNLVHYLNTEEGAKAIKEASERMAKALNMNFGEDGKDELLFDFTVSNFIALRKLEESYKPKNDYNLDCRNSYTTEYLKEKAKEIGADPNDKNLEYNGIYQRADLDLNSADIKEIKYKVFKQVYFKLQNTYGSKLFAKNGTESNNRFQITSKVYNNPEYKKIFPNGVESLKEMYREELQQVLGVLLGEAVPIDSETPDIQDDNGIEYDQFVEDSSNGEIVWEYNAEYVVNADEIAESIKSVLANQTDNLKEISNNISLFHAAAYLMGGTYDHMASLDQPYKPEISKEGFKEFFDKNHFIPKDGYSFDDIWKACMEDEHSPKAQLTQFQLQHPDVKDFLDPKNYGDRAKLLQSFILTLDMMVDYVPEITDVKKEPKQVIAPQVESKYVAKTSIEKYLDNNQHIGVNKALKHFYDNFAIKGLNSKTKIVTVTGADRQQALFNLALQYKNDISKTKSARLGQDSLGLILDKVDEQLELYNKNGTGTSVQFYSKDTNTIYVLPLAPNGEISHAEENMNNEVRIPHEIMHSLSVEAIDYYDSQLKAFERKPDSSRWTDKDKFAFKALKRLYALKGEFDLQLPSLEEIDKETNPQLYFYVANKQNDEATRSNLKEFIASFGSMTDEQINSLMAGLHQRPLAERSVSALAAETYKDAFKLGNILKTVRDVFRKFISKLFGVNPDSATAKDILFANMAILNSALNDDRANNRILGKFQKTIKADKTVSFLDESEYPYEDTKVQIDTQMEETEFVASPEKRTDIIKELSRSLSDAVMKKLSTAHAGKSVEPKKIAQIDQRNAELFTDALTKSKSVHSMVVKPLQNLGLEIGDEIAFTNTVNLLALFRDIKAPVFGDVAHAVTTVLKNLYAEDFCDDITNQAQLERGANIVKFLQGTDGLDKDLVIPVVFALSQTDPTFRKILSKVEYKKERGTNDYLKMDVALNHLGYQMLDLFNDKIKHEHQSTNFEQQFDKLIDRMIAAEQDYTKSTFLEKAIDKANGFIDSTLFEGLLHKVGLNSALVEKKVVDAENSLNNVKIIPHAVKELVHDIIAGTDDSYKVMTKIVKAKNSVQQDRQNALEQIPQITKNRFATKLSDEQWSRFTRTIGKSGLATLFENDTDKLMQLMSDGNVQFEEMEKCKAVIKDKYRIDKCQQLADYMMTGKAGFMLLRNPVAIAKALGSNKQIEASQEEIDACDRLVSLMALQKLTTAERKEIMDLLPSMKDGKFNEDSNAMSILLNTVKNQEKIGIEKASQSFRGMNNWIKGSVPSVMQDANSFKVAPLKDKEEMERMGYKLIREYKGAGVENLQLGVYHTDFNHGNYLNAGGLQFTASTANGINLSTGGSLAPNAGRITNLRTVQRILAYKHYTSSTNEDLVPLFDANGAVYAFERTLDPSLVNNSKYLKPETDFAKLLGIQEGRIKEEAQVKGFNEGIVDMLADKYDKAENKKDYVNLFEETDPTVVEVIKLMPADLRKYIEKKFDGSFMVLRSEVNDIIGYHSASITDSWTGESRLNPSVQNAIVACAETVMGKNAFKYLKKFEDGEHSLVVSAKNTIIIRSVVVPITNVIANYIQLAIEGVPVNTMLKYTPVVLKEINQYVKFRNEILKIDQELAGETHGYRKNQLESAKAVLQKAISNLSIGYLIEQKEFSSIADLGNNDRDLDLTEGNIGDKIIAQIDKMTDNELVRSVTHYAAITPDTSLYKLLEKANQYGDFLGKAILYKDLTERRLMTPEEAHKVVADEFVNYVRLPGRGRDYLERAGLMWFYNYKLRMMRVMMRNLKQRPLTTLALSACGLPTPLTDSLAGKFGVLGYSIGPSMMWNIFSSNPFLALLGLIF